MRLPSGINIDKNTPIYPGSNFTWGEVTNNCQRPIKDLIIDNRLIISARKIEQNIVGTAMHLDEYRYKLGNRPVLVTSWYRPDYINERVGGSKYSRHQYGDAVDWKSRYHSPRQIASLLEADHIHGGYHAYYGFTHTDWRGHKARW